MSDEYAFGLIGWGGVALAVGTLAQAYLSSHAAARGTDPGRGWPRVLSWGALATGAVMNAVGALHFAGLY